MARKPRSRGGRDSWLRAKQWKGGWLAASELLKVQGYPALALEVRGFVAQLPPVKTERELISEDVRKRIRAAPIRDDVPTR
jgi:hypothetical protein